MYPGHISQSTTVSESKNLLALNFGYIQTALNSSNCTLPLNLIDHLLGIADTKLNF